MKLYATCRIPRMSSEYSRLLLNKLESNPHVCLETYLEADFTRAKNSLTGERAVEDCEQFRNGIENLTGLISEFLSQKNKSLSILALGKIQSGKTSHMLGTIAWAIDTPIAFSTIFTGINNDLNNQTVDRLNRSLGELGKNYIKVYQVPTSEKSSEYLQLRTELEQVIFQRITRTIGENGILLPVLATLKTTQRINTLEYLHNELSEKYGSEIVSLLLDDEADQASQNSGSSKGEETKIYEAISNVRKTLVRNVYLAYTATPQAVLLTDRRGALRPDLTVLVPPRSNYFGLDSVVSESYSKNLIEIQDWEGSSSSITQIPSSLKSAIHEYFWASTTRFLYPEIFFSESIDSTHVSNQFMRSTQMMIHESSRVALHKAMFRFVSDEIIEFKGDLLNHVTNNSTKEFRIEFESILKNSWLNFKRRLNPSIGGQFPEHPSEAMISELLNLVGNTQIVVVNGDKTRPNVDVDFPVSDSDWEKYKSWICIGGDILGRGLTIPQLLTTYFLRSSKIPNFDTVSQQMRFCGYRKNYESFTSIWAENQTFASFRYMQEIESVVWNRAKRWDQERIKINVEIPRVLYASPVSSRMEPTRKSVRDPNLIDSKVKGEVVFSASKIMQPHLFRSNFELMRRWIGDLEERLRISSGWYVLEDLSNADIYSLLGQWACDESEKSRLLGAMELFAADMTALGLANVPRACFIARDILEYPPLRDERDLRDLAIKTKFYRTISNSTETLHFSKWADSVVNNFKDSTFKPINVTHIGGTLRKLKQSLDFDSTVFIIEFMRGVQGKGSDARTSALGITLTILSPDDYEVRTIGHA
jgi:hypothetical protein